MSLDSNSVVVITGAASGIGRALAVRLSKENITGIAISDVNKEGLDETVSLIGGSDVGVFSMVVDVADREEFQLFRDETVAKFGRATHLINNAGVGLIGTFEQISIEDFEWLMGINFWGTVYGVKCFLPVLKQQQVAHIINLSSVFGLIAPPEQTAYSASKFAVRGFTEALRHELESTSVLVSSVHPGGIRTEIARNSKLGKDTPRIAKKQGEKFFDYAAWTEPATAAEVIIKGIKNKNPRILIGKDARMISIIYRTFPKRYLQVIEKIVGHRFSFPKK